MEKTTTKLSIVLLIVEALPFIPFGMVQGFLKKSIKTMLVRHPRVFEKLSPLNYTYLIEAYDLPFNFYLNPSLPNPSLYAIKKNEKIQTDATIKGSLSNLLSMFEGKLDGDAAFFSKEIIIEGSTSASVALRNALDGEDMDIINDLSHISENKYLQSIIKKLSIMGFNNYTKLQKKLDLIISSINSPLEKKQKEFDIKINDINQELDNILSIIKKINKEQIRKKSDYTN